ncbi:MAG: hypothetical protein P8Z80_12285 [Pseudolabrys sp.]|jgi:hypothetical protein
MISSQRQADQHRDAVADQDCAAQKREREQPAFHGLHQLGVLAVVGLAQQVGVVVGDHAGELDQPAGDEGEQGRPGGQHAVVVGEADADHHGRDRGGKGVAGIDQLAGPHLAQRPRRGLVHFTRLPADIV